MISEKKIYLFDIDNTLTINELGDCIEYTNPKLNTILFNLAKSLNASSNNKVYYLTARRYDLLNVTKKWLLENELISKRRQLFFVEDVSQKINILKLLIDKGLDIEYYDDLSYNHENGKIMFYTKVIEQVKEMKLEYYGFAEIESLKTKGINE